MFSNIGSKVRKLTVFLFILGIIGSIAAGYTLATNLDIVTGIVAFAVLALLVWIGSWATYGIGVAADKQFPNDRGMFARISRKLKVISIVSCVLGMLLSIACGVLMIIGNALVVEAVRSVKISGIPLSMVMGNAPTGTVSGIITIVVGCLTSWIGSWIPYAIGVAAERDGRKF